MHPKFDESLIQYYEHELEVLAPRGAEAGNIYLPEIGELVLMITEGGGTGDDGSVYSEAWSDVEADEQKIVYFHESTGWSVLLSWIGYQGVEGHRMEYFNPIHLNPGFTLTRDFKGSMGTMQTYQTWAMQPERPFWDLFSAVVEKGEKPPQLGTEDYARILGQLEIGLSETANI